MLGTGKSFFKNETLYHDQVIVGEKVVPLQQEGHLTLVPYVTGAVMFGREKTQTGVLLELSKEQAFDPNDQSTLVAFRNKIWYGCFVQIPVHI